jgi:hypothetical protein
MRPSEDKGEGEDKGDKGDKGNRGEYLLSTFNFVSELVPKTYFKLSTFDF